MSDLREIVPGGDRPKGYAPYSPRGRNIVTGKRIIVLYEQMKAADALPLGPRQVGYRLKEIFPGEYDKEGNGLVTSFEMIERIVMRLAQAERLPLAWIADASAVTYDPGGYDDPADYLRNLPKFERDLRQGQPVVVEIYAETRETLPLIRRIAAERGVLVYSRGGSAGPRFAARVALRAVERGVRWGQSTFLLGIADFDEAGIKRILRPHVENVSAFLYGTDSRGHDQHGNVTVVACDGQTIDSVATATVRFEHLLLTPEDALSLAETEAEREQVQNYLDSGTGLWDRDIELLKGLRKIETEALDPRVLRDRVVKAIESHLDLDALRAVREQAEHERRALDHALEQLARTFTESEVSA